MHEKLKALNGKNTFAKLDDMKELLKLGMPPCTWKDCGSNELKVYYKAPVASNARTYASFYVRGTIANRNFLSKHSTED